MPVAVCFAQARTRVLLQACCKNCHHYGGTHVPNTEVAYCTFHHYCLVSAPHSQPALDPPRSRDNRRKTRRPRTCTRHRLLRTACSNAACNFNFATEAVRWTRTLPCKAAAHWLRCLGTSLPGHWPIKGARIKVKYVYNTRPPVAIRLPLFAILRRD